MHVEVMLPWPAAREEFDLCSHSSLMEKLIDGAALCDVVSLGLTYSFTACIVN